MSFEKLNETSISNIHDRSCVIIVNANKKESAMIKNILDNNISDGNEELWTNKAMIFNNITQIKINGFLDSLKKMKIARPLSAVVTETTIDWTLNKLVYNLIQERKAIQSGTTLNH